MSWPVSKLREVICFVRGVTFAPEDRVEPFSDGSTVVMRTKNVQIEGLDQSDLIAVPSRFVKRAEQELQEGDTLISSANSWNLVGKACYVPTLGYAAAAGGFISILRPKCNIVDPKYLYYWIASPEVQNKIRSCGRKTTNISNLDVDRFLELEVPIPPLVEQKRIAAILDKVDAIRLKRQQAIQLADDFLRAVFLDMFGDPVTNPNGWDLVKLGTLIVLGPNNGLYKPSNYYGVGTRILRIDGFYFGEVISESNLKRVRVSEDERARFSLSVGDVVINRVNSREYLGKTALIRSLEEVVLYESNMMRFAIDARKIDPEYFIFLMQQPFMRSQILASAKDAVNQSSINQQDVKSLEILLPPIALQKKYRNLTSTVRNCKEKLVSHSQINHGLLGSLVQKAFQGEV
nr:restriction endonuclease subunit S [Stenotrophomonas geniculata]